MRSIKELRVYCECYEQGLLDYISDNEIIKGIDCKVLYTKPNSFSSYSSESIISHLFSRKDFDGLISAVDEDDTEHPIVTIEFSTAVPTDDHIVQRFDVMYWSTYYQTPCIKISPTVMNNTNFGGGSKIKIQHEYYTTLNMNGVYYHVDWPLIPDSDLVMTDPDRVSCPPFLKELKDILNGKTPKHNGKPIQGHHAYSVSQYPHLANKGEVIYPVTPNEHFNGWHGGNYKNSLPGEPIIDVKDF